jgi:iron complex transport system ATP-binding protein
VIRARGVIVVAGMAKLVDGIDLDVRAGELVAIVGPNGAGKSTLLGALSGDRKLAGGSVRIADRDVHALSTVELARVRAVLPQRSALSLAFTATEVVCLAHRAINESQARTHLAAVELAALADRSYPSLSGGEQQRVQLARVLAQLSRNPGAALFLDEPTSALDPRHQQLVMSLARDAATRGHSVVTVLHDLTLAASCDRVALLAGGKLLAYGPPADVLVADGLEAAYATQFEILAGSSGLVVAVRGVR